MGRWTPFASADQFAFDSKSVKRQWARLHACDQEVLPADAAVLEAWALFHNGHFEAAHQAGLRLGSVGTTVANKAACVYATQLESSASARRALYQEVSARAQEQLRTEPGNPNAHYLLAYSLGRYSQGISVTKALAQGLGNRIKSALETTIALQPQHADAHFALGVFHAEIIDKIGALIGAMTYGAKKDTSLQMFQRGFTLLPHSPIGLLEYAIALHMLEGETRQNEASTLCAHAAALKPVDAQEYLAIVRAKSGLNR
jgi:hypothetical protein